MIKRKVRIATVFSGIGSPEFALLRMNQPHEIVFACDNGDREIEYDHERELNYIRSLASFDEKKEYVDNLYLSKTRRTNFVKQSYLSNYQLDPSRYYEDICLLDGNDFKGEVDVFIGGSPCQSFSSVGYQQGFEDARGTLFYDFARLIQEIQPNVFVYENVRGVTFHDKKKTISIINRIFDNLEYDVFSGVLDAKDFGIPQTRRRYFAVGFKRPINGHFNFPQDKIDCMFSMTDFTIENNFEGAVRFDKQNGKIIIDNIPGVVQSQYFLSATVDHFVMQGGSGGFYQKPITDLKIARPILATMGNCHRAGIDNYITIQGKRRMLTEREALRLMGFTDEFKIVVSRTQAYFQAGNSIVVDVMMAIFREIFIFLEMEEGEGKL
ncbi:MAG: DNA (cytosine-5-)-methyltransferase [Firmicutes bacterium]|nr:DNA (cytosine-5-)-methyltransferase [Bacillota bacterium]